LESATPPFVFGECHTPCRAWRVSHSLLWLKSVTLTAGRFRKRVTTLTSRYKHDQRVNLFIVKSSYAYCLISTSFLYRFYTTAKLLRLDYGIGLSFVCRHNGVYAITFVLVDRSFWNV